MHVLVADRTVYILPYCMKSGLDDCCTSIMDRLVAILSKVVYCLN